MSHNTMRGLSGGQKVKIVLGAATWRRPHVMCLDEPTSEFFISSRCDILAQSSSF